MGHFLFDLLLAYIAVSFVSLLSLLTLALFQLHQPGWRGTERLKAGHLSAAKISPERRLAMESVGVPETGSAGSASG